MSLTADLLDDHYRARHDGAGRGRLLAHRVSDVTAGLRPYAERGLTESSDHALRPRPHVGVLRPMLLIGTGTKLN
jgi:hypothetical protein